MIAHLAGAGPALAAEPGFSANRLVVRLQPGAARAAWQERTSDRAAGAMRSHPRALDALARRVAAARLEPEFPNEPPGGEPDLSAFWIAHLEPGQPVDRALAAARASAEVVEASPIARVPVEPLSDASGWLDASNSWSAGPPAAPGFLAAPPNDSLWSRCYWLWQSSRRDLHALEAWDVTRGDSSSVIAIIDTGVLRWHPDLGGKVAGQPERLWTNRAESGGAAGVDDDANGHVDDTWGWDFVTLDSAAMARPGEDWRDPDNDPTDFAVHGTAVAGVAAAIGNNVSGALGVAPQCRVMALRVGYSSPFNPAGVIDMTWVAQAILYAVRNGATVINGSFTTIQQPDLDAAVTAAIRAGVVMVMAAGNREPFHWIQEREDVISVAATDNLDKITMFSTREDWVDLAAPGQSIATTTLRPTGTDSIGRRTPHYSPGEAGTSFSAPMVAAGVAMLQSDRRARGLAPLSPEQTRLRLIETTDDISALNPGGGFGSGRLNLARLLTDPPRSAAFGAGARTVGAPVIQMMESGSAWLAHATADSHLVVIRAGDGDTLARAALGDLPTGGPAAADRGGGRGSVLFVALTSGRIAAFDFAGRPLAGWPVATAPSRSDLEVSPALADLDGDGEPEVIWGGSDGNVWAWRLDGSRVPGFPRTAGIAGDNLRVALADLDGAPGAEIVSSSNNDSLYAFLGSGAPLPGWPIFVGPDATPPLIMRSGRLGRTQVVVGSGNLLLGYGPDGTARFARNHWPRSFVQEPISADLDADGSEEIVVIASGPNRLVVMDSIGVLLAAIDLSSRTVGGPVAGPLAPGTGAQILTRMTESNGQTSYRAYRSDLTLLPGWPKLGRAGSSPSLAEVDGDDATEIAAGSAGTGVLYVFDAGSGTWRDVDGWPTARGNFARTGSRMSDLPLLPEDDAGPAAVADLAATKPGTHDALLEWSAPADQGSAGRVAAYEIRVADTPIDAANFEAARVVAQSMVPGTPGSSETLQVPGLREAATQWFALRSRDPRGNWSAISNVPSLATASVSPAPVSDLHVARGGATSLVLAWTASGDDGASGRPVRYRVRWSESPIDSAAFDLSTQGADFEPSVDAGAIESGALTGLPAGRQVWLRLRAVDAAGNRSPLSNAVQVRVGRLAAVNGIALAPARSPSSAPVAIEWQGDPASPGAAPRLEIFDLGGRVVRRYAPPAAPSGVVTWDGANESGRRVPAGVYFARLTCAGAEARTRLVLVR